MLFVCFDFFLLISSLFSTAQMQNQLSLLAPSWITCKDPPAIYHVHAAPSLLLSLIHDQLGVVTLLAQVLC